MYELPIVWSASAGWYAVGASAFSETTFRVSQQADRGLHELCREFEAVLIRQIIQAMRVFGDEDEDLPGVMPAMDLSAELSRLLAKDGCLGIGEMLFSRLGGKGTGTGKGG